MKTSVAVCTYNGQDYINLQLESIIDQTILVDEIVICDDGSCDSTIEVIERIIKSNKIPIKLIKNTRNLGYTKNFEKAISLCSGDIIFLSDQDDIWMPNKVETICKYFENNENIDFVYTNAILINMFGVNNHNQTLFDTVGMDDQNKIKFNSGFAYDVLGTSGRVTGATTALRASFVPYCIPFPQTIVFSVHDEMMAISALLRNKIGYIDQCLIKYRLHGKQSVGLWMLFKFPSQKWELATNTIVWHESMVENNRKQDLAKIRFMFKRFWIRKKSFSFFRFLGLYLLGEYKKYYTRPSTAFIWDVKGVIYRFLDNLKRLTQLEIKINNDI